MTYKQNHKQLKKEIVEKKKEIMQQAFFVKNTFINYNQVDGLMNELELLEKIDKIYTEVLETW